MKDIKIVKTNNIIEIEFETIKLYENPFMDVILDVEFTEPMGEKKIVPAFWAGVNQWIVRYTSSQIGIHSYCSLCNFDDDSGLNNIKGEIEIQQYYGDNPLYKHGALKVNQDQRHFEHRDSTPFLWLADTWWKALSKRLTWDGFQELCGDRIAKGFNAVQIVCGPYPDEKAFDPGWANEGGMPYENREYTIINPEYFNYADRRISLLVKTGLMPVLVGAWGRADCDSMKVAGVEGLKRHWRHLIARYGAYPLVWVPGGEIGTEAKYGEGPWGEIITYIKELDPYQRLITSHEGGERAIHNKPPLLDFMMVGGSHFDPTGTATLSTFISKYNQKPTMPVLCGETGYEGHMQRAFEDVQRYVFWMYMLNGGAGHTYGAAGMHHMGVEGDPGLNPVWDHTTWQQAKEFNGAKQVGIGRRLLEEYPWQKFEPHPEWSDADCFSAGIPKKVRMIFRSNRSVYDWSGPRLKELEVGIVYKAFYFDPSTGRRFDIKPIKRVMDYDCPSFYHGDDVMIKDQLLVSNDDIWENIGRQTLEIEPPAGVATEKGKICATNMVSVIKTMNEKDVLISVDASNNAQAGIVLRFQDLDNYIVALYNPIFKAIYILERHNGGWAPFFSYRIPYLGIVDTPNIGSNFTLSTSISNEYASIQIDDGQNKYCSPAVKIKNLDSGKVGLWRTDIGITQIYSNFIVSKTDYIPPIIQQDSQYHINRTGEDIAEPIPSPQDWVLVLENVEQE